MESEEFLDEVLSRVKSFLASSRTESHIRPSESHASLARTSDLNLPLEGRGLEAALDDIESVLRNSVRTTAPGFSVIFTRQTSNDPLAGVHVGLAPVPGISNRITISHHASTKF